MYRVVLWIYLLGLLLPGVVLNAQDDYIPEFVPGPCPVHFASGYEVACGTVTLPQDRLHPQERGLDIAVAVFKARSSSPAPDPLIFLDGGPGSRTLDAFVSGLGTFPRRLNQQRDFIVFDYRGIGHSNPALTCPESLDATDDSWVSVCRARYAAQGVDVTDFTTRDNAADAADIMRALGYDSYNVWGGSYGSSVALTLLRDHPENVRAAIVTAMQAPQGDLQA
ncbi:MAG: alpha/beta hydrolase, partial [Anaerolineae bacterium]|nr:alpha/beta hydrolase [Anaerolineae bacterium]